MSSKENIMPLSEKRENESFKHTNKPLSKPGLKETKISNTKLHIQEEKSTPTGTVRKQVSVEEEEDVLVYIPEKPRRSPSPHSMESLLEYPANKINIHHRKEANLLRFEPPSTDKTSTQSRIEALQKELNKAIKEKEALASKLQAARKELKQKTQQAQEIDHKMEQVTQIKARIASNKQEIVESQSVYDELMDILENANEKGLEFDKTLSGYNDQVNELLNELSLTNYRIQEFKESHCKAE
ncbi:hypothetical protein MUCCIDRAFT_158613 [Mucor lusitanicus CBS 277.49]|uniref:Uncharacterized protein n=1 Tax=Mucor lusitanicus CBS 277.49 TaxID=747725 RepID=A0A168PXX5_MUCCL|nr:hypothetical protein MUCCIDRAFT_158613 [Mucor lusitanicus CBS 277.49]